MACQARARCGKLVTPVSSWVRVATLDELPPGSRVVVDLAYETVALFNVEGQIYCIADICAHDGGPLAEGDPATSPVPTYPVRVEGKDILVEEPEEAW